jgi:endonuclease YncB( thermonuclease family)
VALAKIIQFSGQQRKSSKTRRRPSWLRNARWSLALVGVALTLWFAAELYPSATGGTGASVLRGSGAFVLCAGAQRQNCVVDGDTIRYGGIKIRLADIDTPEVFSPKCAAEAARGRRATERLLELLNAGPFQVVVSGDRDEDRYGRKLRTIERDGRSVGEVLIAEGLARAWDGARRSWCG